MRASRIAVIPDVLYDYAQRWGSMSLQIDEAGLNDYVRTFGYRRIFLEEHEVYHKFRGSMQFFKYKNYPFTFGWLVLLHLKKGSCVPCRKTGPACPIFSPIFLPVIPSTLPWLAPCFRNLSV